MDNKKDIGKVFRSKLDLLDKSPNNLVWTKIQSDLQKKQKNKRLLIPLWIKATIVLTVLSLLSIMFNHDSIKGYVFSTPSQLDSIKKPTNQLTKALEHDSLLDQKPDKLDLISNTNVTSKQEKKIRDNRLKNSTSTKQKQNLSKRLINLVQSRAESDYKNKTATTIDKNKSLTTTTVENNPEEKNSNTQKASLKFEQNKTDSLTILPTEKRDNPSIKKELLNLYVYGSPTYAFIMTKKSPIDKRLEKNAVVSEMTFSYGAYISYKMNDHWTVLVGVSKTNLHIITKNAPINTSNYSNINYKNNFSNSMIYNQSNNSETMDILQEISYTEIPLEIKLNIRDTKFGISAFGGLSFMFLDNNLISIETENQMKYNIGETKNLSSTAYSLNLGIGLDYKICKKLKLNVEPVFKYHLMDYKNSGKINPYTIGIQTGLQYSFSKKIK